jgi:hypothetical protein
MLGPDLLTAMLAGPLHHVRPVVYPLLVRGTW